MLQVFIDKNNDYYLIEENGYGIKMSSGYYQRYIYTKVQIEIGDFKPFKRDLKLNPKNSKKLFKIRGHEKAFIVATRNGTRIITKNNIIPTRNNKVVTGRHKDTWLEYCKSNNLTTSILKGDSIKSVTIKTHQ